MTSLERVYVDPYRYFYADRTEGTGHLYFQEGGYEPHIRRELERLIPSSRGFLDIGANVGLHVLNAKSIRLDIPITAVEVNPDNVATLALSLAENNLQDVTIINAAVAERACVIKIDARQSNATCAHLGLWGRDEGRYAPALALDSLNLEHIDLVKIDIDGWEWRAFQGASKLLKQRPTIIFEYHLGVIDRGGIKGPELLTFLTDLGYRLEPLTGPRHSFKTGQLCHNHVAKHLDGVTDLLATHL